ncbi:MAG: threonine ammonia-lyase [Candidatus Fimivivens sp.]
MLTLDSIYHAAFTMKNVVRKTDLIHAPKLSTECKLFLKTENLQITGSFKVRGAFYKISQLSNEERAHGVIACSAGNHAQGVALSAARAGIGATICIPGSAPISKVEATRSYGAKVELVKGVYDDAAARAAELQQQTGATFIHPFDDPHVIAGQGTIGLEILDQLPQVEAVVVPIGGGGLISGIACAIKSLKPNVKVYGVQAAGAPSMFNALAHRERQTLTSVSTMADGIAVKMPGVRTYDLCEKYVDEIVTVTDDEICTAILALIEKQKMTAEGAGAVPVAAILANKLPIAGKNVVCVVSGGNIDVNILSRVISRGLLMTGRTARLRIELSDTPGQLVAVSSILAECGANVTGVDHNRSSNNKNITDCFLDIAIETRDRAHIDQIKQVLADNGFCVDEI